MAYKNGKNGRVNWGGTNLKVIEWDGDDTTEAVETTNTESGGYQEMDPIGGITAMNGSFTAIVIDGTAPPKSTNTGTLVDCKLYEGSHTNTEAYCFKAILSSVKHANKVKSTDPITVVCQYHSSGPIGYNTDVIPS